MFVIPCRNGPAAQGIIRTMDRITGVQLFARIVETGSFSKASSDLGITQPTATKHVAALEAQLGARPLNRNTRGVSPTEIGTLYYEKCKAIQRELEEADNLAALLQSTVRGQRASAPRWPSAGARSTLALEVHARASRHHHRPSFDDRYVNLVEQGGRGAAHGAAGRFRARRALPGRQPLAHRRLAGILPATAPRTPAELAQHDCLVYATCRATTAGASRTRRAAPALVPVKGPAAASTTSRPCWLPAAPGSASRCCPGTARESLATARWSRCWRISPLPTQELHAVFPRPLVPGKVSTFIDFLKIQLDGEWWTRAREPQSMRRGFTLIEVLMVLAVIAILATLAMPSLQDRIVRDQIVEA